MPRFSTLQEDDILIGAGATIERTLYCRGGLAQSVVVEGAGSRIDARDPGFGTRFGPEDLKAIPTRRASMFDFIRATPGISRPPREAARRPRHDDHRVGLRLRHQREPVSHRRHELHLPVQRRRAIGTGRRLHPGDSGPVDRRVRRVRQRPGRASSTSSRRQGGERFLYDASYYGQAAGLTSQPVRLPIPSSNGRESGYERARYRDFTTNLGGPVVSRSPVVLCRISAPSRLRQSARQRPEFPRTYEQDKGLAKLTWRLAPGWQLVQSIHYEFWVNPDPPTAVTPFEATLRRSASVPAITFGHLTHTSSANTVWDVRVGRFVYSQETPRAPATSRPRAGSTT